MPTVRILIVLRPTVRRKTSIKAYKWIIYVLGPTIWAIYELRRTEQIISVLGPTVQRLKTY